MDAIWSYCRENKIYFASGALVLGTSAILYRSFLKQKRQCGVDYPKDTVILYTAPSSKYIPSLGHFAMKLVTYLRVNKIAYRVFVVSKLRTSLRLFGHTLLSVIITKRFFPDDVDYVRSSGAQTCRERRKGPKGKIPWIECNGIAMGDSKLIIEFLNREFSVDMNRHLNKEQRAVAWAIQKWLEEFTYWLNIYSRCIFQDEMLGEMLECHLLKGGEVQNVSDYLDRIKNTYWPDWDELCRNTAARV